jgi:hypothetical protein
VRTLEKPIRRRLPITFDRSEWTVYLQRGTVSFKRKFGRKSFTLPWDYVIRQAIHLTVAAEQEEKHKTKKRNRRS